MGTTFYPEHFSPYRAPPNARTFGEVEIVKMILRVTAYTDQTEWAAPMVLAAKKGELLRYWVGYQNINVVFK